MTEPTKLHPRRVLAAMVLLALGVAGQARSDTPTPKAQPAKTAAAKAAPANASPAKAEPAKPPTAKKPTKVAPAIVVATVGSRKVDDWDIKRAATALYDDPLRKRDPAAWRRMLLDRCVDRELLAAEAEHRGLDKDPALATRIAEREFLTLLREIYQRVLIPALAPTTEELRQLRAEKLHRGVDLYYILIRDNQAGSNKELARRVYEKAKAGARFDSLAKIYSMHPPSHAAGGHFGWVLGRDLDPASYKDQQNAKVGDVLGLYSGPYGHEIYKMGAFQELSDDSLYNLIYTERWRGIASNYDKGLLAKYHFAIDSTQVQSVIFATGSETPDSILASLGPDGTRPAQGVRPAIGILARCDGDSVTFPEMLHTTPPVLGRNGRMRIRNAEALYELCARVVLHQLTVRDAKDRGIDKDPLVARELRLSREEILTKAMVARSLPSSPDDAVLRGLTEDAAGRNKRPRAAVARVAMFASPDSAAQALQALKSTGMADSLLEARQMRKVPRARQESIWAGCYGTVTLLDDPSGPWTPAFAGVSAGQFAPVIATDRGWAVAQVQSIEEPRPLTFEEAAPLALREWRNDAENKVVLQMLERLRAKTPARIVPGRLEAVKLAGAGTTSTTTREAAR
jgi:PPIC-type peptidyl-prolyl cis-trans isomerase-like protein/parvulin-like peptidyl-prolyl cis-trans isomerase-like protein